MAKPSGDGAVIAAAMGITEREDGIEVLTSVRPTGVPTPSNKINIISLRKQMSCNRYTQQHQSLKLAESMDVHYT